MVIVSKQVYQEANCLYNKAGRLQRKSIILDPLTDPVWGSGSNSGLSTFDALCTGSEPAQQDITKPKMTTVPCRGPPCPSGASTTYCVYCGTCNATNPPSNNCAMRYSCIKEGKELCSVKKGWEAACISFSKNVLNKDVLFPACSCCWKC
jgi:hypothetical protein